MNPVLNGTAFLSPLDLQFGPDGALYLLEWGGGFGRDNPNSGLYRIDYAADGRAPTARAEGTPNSGRAPLEVQFSSAGSIDRDGDEITYRWDFGDGTTSSTEANPKHTYTEIGNYEARLTVTEATASAKTGTATVPDHRRQHAPDGHDLGAAGRRLLRVGRRPALAGLRHRPRRDRRMRQGDRPARARA